MSSILVDEILMPSTLASNYSSGDPLNSLIGIKRLNVIVGPNNSGKSRLLRELYFQSSQLLMSSTHEASIAARVAMRQALPLVPEIEKVHWGVANIREKICQAFGFHKCNQRFSNVESLNELKQLFNEIDSQLGRYQMLQSPPLNVQTAKQFSDHLKTIIKSMDSLQRLGKSSQASDPKPRLSNASFVYIPTLRGMRKLGNDHHAYFDRTFEDYIRNRTRGEYTANENIEDARINYHGTRVITGLDMHEWLTRKLLGNLSEREEINDYQSFISKRFFNGLQLALIPRQSDHTVYIKIGNERERPIHMLGDGLQQLIILTLPLFQNRGVPLFLFIEEPDLFLHPGFQRVLIEAILEERECETYVFVATHSPQFLDITISSNECSIFRCEKLPVQRTSNEVDADFRVTCTGTGDLATLKQIGVLPSSVMFANCTIWVEGITDRLYYNRYLSILMRSRGVYYVEGLHYSFVEYSGANVKHWSFYEENGIDVDRLCAPLLIILDQDSGDKDHLEIIRDKLQHNAIILPVREVENLLAPHIIESVVRSYEGRQVDLKTFVQSDYAHGYLGTFINDHVLVDKTKSKRAGKNKTYYAGKSGTIKGKVEFCNRAMSGINSLDDMSQAAKDIAERMLDFISEHNSV